MINVISIISEIVNSREKRGMKRSRSELSPFEARTSVSTEQKSKSTKWFFRTIIITSLFAFSSQSETL